MGIREKGVRVVGWLLHMFSRPFHLRPWPETVTYGLLICVSQLLVLVRRYINCGLTEFKFRLGKKEKGERDDYEPFRSLAIVNITDVPSVKVDERT